MANSNGSMNVISGVPTRVGAPVEDIVKVNTALSQRYWQNQQQQMQLNNAVKNMPVYAKEVDNQILAEVSNGINDSFKSIIENDNWEDATAVVNKTANDVANNEKLKALQSNVALAKQNDAQWEERLKNDKNGTLRAAKPVYDAMTRQAYIAQGGSIGKDGLPQQMKVFAPTTNLDVSDEVSKIAEIAKSMHATLSTTFGGREYLTQNDLAAIPDGVVKNVLANQLKSETKIETESLSEGRLKAMAKEYLQTDGDYNTKLMEIAQYEKFKKTGTLDVTKADLQSLGQIAGDSERHVAILMSPAYKELVAKYSGDYNNPNFQKAFNNLYKNDAVYRSGQEALYSLDAQSMANVYYNTVISQKDKDVVDTVKAYEIHKQRLDKHYFETHLYDAVQKAAEANVGSYTANDIASGQVALSLDLANPNTDIYKQYKVLEAAHNAGTLNPAQTKQYMELKASAEALGETSKGIWNTATPEERNAMLSKAWSMWGTDAYKAFASGKQTLANLKENLKGIVVKGGDGIDFSTKNVTDKKVELIGDYVLRNINPQDIFKSNEEIYSQFSKDIALSASGKQNLFARLDKQRNNLYSAIKEKAPDKFVVPTTVMTHVGKTTDLDMQLNKNLIQSLSAGTLTDVTTGKIVNPEEYGIDMTKLKSAIGNNDLNLSGIDIGVVSFNGSKTGGGNYYRLSFPIYDKKVDKDNKLGRTGSVIVRYDGNDALASAHKLEAMNGLRTQLMTTPQVDNRTGKTTYNQGATYSQFQKARQDGNTLARTYGETLRTSDGKDIYEYANMLSTNRKAGIKSVVNIPIGGNTYQFQVNGRPEGYAVDVVRLDSSGNPTGRIPTKIVTDVRDIVTMAGLQKAYTEGLDTKVYNSLMSAFTNADDLTK